MTYFETIALFKDIAVKHKQIKQFGTGEEWEIDEQSDTATLKPGILYPIWFAIPIDATITENAIQRRFEFLVFAIVKKDRSNEVEIINDTQLIITDLIKIFKNESDNYDLINDPVIFPFKEKYGDYCAGHRCEMVIESALNNNYCDVPADDLASPVVPAANWVIRDIITGELIETLDRLHPGTYYIEILTEIRQSLDNPGPTIIQVLS